MSNGQHLNKAVHVDRLTQAIEELPEAQLLQLVDILLAGDDQHLNSAKRISQWQALVAEE